MGHIALYREWRPKTFEEVVEQKFTVLALKQAVISNSIAHAYLFSGTRGTGKTTMAQVFSRAINCLAPENGNPCNKCKVCLGILDNTILDVIEMDAASNNSVDTIRRLCDEIVFSPSIARFKVYIIDEVHMLSTGAFNALLKTLEEPPSHAVFILATTEQHRIPATILSRCQRYEFRRITVSSIVERLLKICEEDKINASDEALKTISKLADGALRDAISLLDQARSAFPENITKEDVLSLVGLVNDEFMFSLATSICDNVPDKGLELVEELILEGRDIIKFTGDLALYFRNVMLCHVCKEPDSLINYPSETIDGMRQIASKMPLSRVISIIKELSSLVSDLRWSSNPRITFEIALIKIMDFQDSGIESNLVSGKNTSILIETAKKTLSPNKESLSSPSNPAREFENKDKNVNIKDDIEIHISQEKTPENKNDESADLISEEETIKTQDDSSTVKEMSLDFQDISQNSIDDDVNNSLEDDKNLDPFLNEVPFEEIDDSSKEDSGESDDLSLLDPFTSGFQESPPEIIDNGSNKLSDKSSIDEDKSVNASVPEISMPAQTNDRDITVSSLPELSIFWPKLLDKLISGGQMTLYLFMLPAKPSFKDDKLVIDFEDADEYNCKEVSSDPNVRIISDTVYSILDQRLKIIVKLKSEDFNKGKKTTENSGNFANNNSDDKLNDGVQTLKKSAEELGIPVHLEE